MEEIAEPVVRNWDFPRSAAGIALLVGFAVEQGVAPEEVLRGTAVSPAVMADPGAQVDAHQELAGVRNLVRALDDRPGLGLELGQRYRPTTFGIFGFAWVSSPTLRDAMALALRYLDLSFAFCTPTIRLGPDEIVLELADDRVPADVRRFLVDRDLAAIFSVVGDLLGARITLRRLELRALEPASAGRYEKIFGIAPVFGAPVNIGTFDAKYLDQPLPQANSHTVALCEAQCRELVARRRERTGIAKDVRDHVTRVGGVAVDMETVAREMGMSSRSLRRHLADAGTSFRTLREEVVSVLAVELLETGVLTVDDVAVRLGYAEASSFIHAFKRWTGQTPTAHLRTRRAG